MGKISAALRLTRIEHSAMLIIAVVSAELISGKVSSTAIFVLSLITAVFISMGAFAINDYFDIEVDRANKKMRPLVTGELKPVEALWITAASMLIGITASIFINVQCTIIALVFAGLSLIYSYRLKELPAVGNMYVAFSMAVPFIFGNYVVASSVNYAVIALFFLVFAAGVAREINGAIRDYAGDSKARKARTLPKIIGIRSSAYVALLLYLVAVAISFWVFVYVPPFSHNAIYLILILVADFMLVYSGVVFVTGRKKLYDAVRNISLAAMLLALVCILLSELIYIRTLF